MRGGSIRMTLRVLSGQVIPAPGPGGTICTRRHRPRSIMNDPDCGRLCLRKRNGRYTLSQAARWGEASRRSCYVKR